ncbi:MAG: type I-E CRISPR-associated protein Cas5/CasD [Dehalococcoidia bacterium]|nr:type I-E CRISPR-associated protein Cas5/CasD [Dehalococcoidia bacterium]
MSVNTLFLRLEGPFQSWGDHESKFVVRRTSEAPTKSGVIGILCAALGVSRAQAAHEWLPKLGALRFGVRIDATGIRMWDYHTVGADQQMRIAEGEGKTMSGAMLTRREYLCDASFLVALQGEPSLITTLEAAMQSPTWTIYLGRRSCPPSRPLLEHPLGYFPDLISALKSIPWRPRQKADPQPEVLSLLIDWEASRAQPEAPEDAIVRYDVPLTFEPPSHGPRFVIRRQFSVENLGVAQNPAQYSTPRPLRPRADYKNSEYLRRRRERLEADRGLCVFCKAPATTVQHVTYRRAGGGEAPDDLRSLCRLCHDAVTMIEYGLGMGLDRINPEEPRWRDRIIEKREQIVLFRSLETRRRRLSAEEVE